MKGQWEGSGQMVMNDCSGNQAQRTKMGSAGERRRASKGSPVYLLQIPLSLQKVAGKVSEMTVVRKS